MYLSPMVLLYQNHEDQYEDAQAMHDIQHSNHQTQMDRYERDRIGNDYISTLGKNTKGLGRAINNNDLDFEPIAKPYEPQGLHSNKEKVDFQYTKPPADETPFDKQEAQAMINSFIKDN